MLPTRTDSTRLAQAVDRNVVDIAANSVAGNLVVLLHRRQKSVAEVSRFPTTFRLSRQRPGVPRPSPAAAAAVPDAGVFRRRTEKLGGKVRVVDGARADVEDHWAGVWTRDSAEVPPVVNPSQLSVGVKATFDGRSSGVGRRCTTRLTLTELQRFNFG